MKKIIHVNMHNIRKNIKAEAGEEILPVLTVKTYKSNEYGYQAILKDKTGKELGRFVYSPDKPLSCGARVYFEGDTDVIDVEVIDKYKVENNDAKI